MGCLADESWAIDGIHTYYQFYFDANKKSPGIQIDFGKYNKPFRGTQIWNDRYWCDGPEIALLHMTPEARSRVYRDLTATRNKSRATVLEGLAAQLERMHTVGWFRRDVDRLEKVENDKWCIKDGVEWCVTDAQYREVVQRADTLAQSAVMIINELRGVVPKQTKK